MYMYVHEPGGQRLTEDVFFNCSPSYSLSNLFLNLELPDSARLAGQQMQELPWFYPFQHRDYGFMSLLLMWL